MEKKYKEDPLSPKETVPRKTAASDLLENAMTEDHGSEEQPSANVSGSSLMRSEWSSAGYLESDTAKDYGNEKQGSVGKAQQGDMAQGVCTIEVRGFNATTQNETIESFLESRRRSGGGEIKDIEFDRKNEVVRVTYYDPTVAEHVLSMPQLKLEYARLTVSQVQKWDGRTIEVQGLRPSASYDAIVLFFESKRRSGGDAVEDVQLDTDNNIAYVMFESPEVAEKVLKKNLQLDGATLTVRPKLSISSRHQSTQDMGEEKEQESQIHDQDSNRHKMEQGRNEHEEELDIPGGDQLTLDVNPHHSDETYVKCTKSEERCGDEEEQSSDFTSTRFSESGAEGPQGNMHQDVCTIEVRGLNTTTHDETIEAFFENRRHSGGGEIKDIDFDKTNEVVRVTFCEPNVAENVLRMSELKLEDATLTVSLVQKWDGRTIEVHGLHPSTSQDAIALFFESKRRSGGDVVEDMHLDSDNNIAYVTFESPEAAENVLRNSLKLEGSTLTVQPNLRNSSRHRSKQREVGSKKEYDQQMHDHDSDGLMRERNEGSTRMTPRKRDVTLQEAQTPTSDTPVESTRHAAPPPPVAPRNVILVSGINDTTTEEVVKMFFENKKRSGGGRVKDLDYRPNEAQATITFHSEEDALRIVQRGALTLNGAELVTKLMIEETIQETACTPTSSCTTTDMSSSCILEIRGFKPGTARDNIEMFIENKSGETELQALDYDTTTGVAVATFRNAEGATQLMNAKNLHLDGVQLSVIRLMDIYAGLDRESCRPRAIKVEGIGKGTTEELLHLLFENRRKSGGGEIEQLDYDNEEDIAVIVFKDADTAERVAQKEQLMIKDSRVQMKLMKPTMSLPVVQGPFEDNLVLVSSLSPNCTGDDLKAFFAEEKTHSEIQQVIFSLHPGVAMTQFTHQPEFDRLRELCVTKPLRGTMLSVQRVQKSTAIQVHNIGKVDETMLSLYFESKRSGGAEVTDIQVFRQDDYALIAFSGCASVQNILAKQSHQVEKQALYVTTYYECLGVIPQNHDTTMPGGWIPKNEAVTGFCPRVFSFLQTSTESRQLVDTKMAKVAAVVEWETYNGTSNSVELTCTIRHTMEDAQTKAKMWSQDVSHTFLDVLTQTFASQKTETLQEAWQKFLKRIDISMIEVDPSKIVVDISDDKCSICITGLRNEVENLSSELKDAHSKVQEEMTREATRVTETTSGHKLHQLRMLNANAFRSQQHKTFTDLTVTIDMKSYKVKFSGMPMDVMRSKLEMLEIFNKMTEKIIEMSSVLVTMLNDKEMRQHVVDEFKNQNICAVFNGVEGNKLGVYALSDEHVCTAIDVIKTTTCDTSIEADMTKMAAPKKWKQLIKDQQSKHGGLLTITESGNTVVLVGAKSRMDVALEEIQSFLKDNIISEQFVPMEHGVADYIHKYMTEEIAEIVQTFQHSAVKITPRLDGPYGFVVSGNSYGLQNAVQKLRNVPDNVNVHQFKVDKPGMPKYLTSEGGQHSIQRLERQHTVVIEPVGKYTQNDGVLAANAGASATGIESTSRVALPGGATVEVVRGDLTKFHADAIVNAANGQLDHLGGLAKAISDAGGPEIQRECRNHVQRNGDVADGHVYVSTPGRLPCKKVIHAVGPIWKGGHSSEENSLYEAVFESMLAAEECHLSSIAVPALSSGIFGFPIDKCTLTIISAVKDFLEDRTHSRVKKVSLVDPKEDVLRVFHKSLGSVFGSKVMTTSGNRQSRSQTKAPHPSPRTKTQSQTPNTKIYSRKPQPTPGGEKRHATTHRKQTSKPGKAQLTTAEGITLTLCKSEIAKEQVDVIINSSSCDLQLTHGAVALSLLQNGGNTIQTECQQNAPNGLQFGEVVMTSGGHLKCRYIVHGACCPWDSGKGGSEQVLRQMLTNCFQAVHGQKEKSVAFPAVGTGQLGFPHRLVAKIMLDELRQFSSRNPQTSLKDVRFVVYPKDPKSIQAFEEVLFAGEPGLQKTESQPARALARPERGAVGGTPSRSISEESDELIHIGAIDVDIVHGDLTQEDTDAIVNGSDSRFGLQGAISKAIVAAGGPSIVRECKRLGTIGHNGIAVTSSGHLPCSHIIHIDAQRRDLTAVIESVLMEADSLEIESIAFPALGTGMLGLSPNTMADAMLDAVERFTEQKPESYLKLVKIVVFQLSMMQSFRKCAFRKASGKKGWIKEVSAMFGRVKDMFFGDTTAEESSVTRQHITFNIFGASHSAITAAKKAMQQLCDAECKEVIIDSENDQASIAKLTSTEINQIRALQENLDVKITIVKNKQDVCIRIQGMPADTSQASLQIVNIFRQMEHEDKDKTLASVYAKQVHWKYAEEESFINYPECINGLLESAYQSKKSHVEWKEDTGVKYRVTFRTMKETRDGDRTIVDVKREAIGVGLELPSHWSPMGKDEHVKLEQLQPSSQEYKDVESKFLSTAQNTVHGVTNIERIQNPGLYRQYMLRKEELTKRIKQPTAIECSLWHGTSASAITSINNGGFNRSYCGKNATVYGKGVYFAVCSNYSAHNQYATPDVTGLKHVYQARVLTGEYTTGNPAYRVPPSNPATPGFPFDTVVDNVSTPGIYVIFLDNQAYPEYLITFS